MCIFREALWGLKKVGHFSNKVGSLDTSTGQQAGNQNVWAIQGGLVWSDSPDFLEKKKSRIPGKLSILKYCTGQRTAPARQSDSRQQVCVPSQRLYCEGLEFTDQTRERLAAGGDGAQGMFLRLCTEWRWGSTWNVPPS